MIQDFIQVNNVEDNGVFAADWAVHFNISVDKVLKFHLKPCINVERQLLKFSDFEWIYFILLVLFGSAHSLFEDMSDREGILLFLQAFLLLFLVLFCLVLLLVLQPVYCRLDYSWLLIMRCRLNLHHLDILNSAPVQSLQFHGCRTIFYFTVCTCGVKSVLYIALIIMRLYMVF